MAPVTIKSDIESAGREPAAVVDATLTVRQKIAGAAGAPHFAKLDHLRFLAAALILFHHCVPAIICAAAGVSCEATNTLRLTANCTGFDFVARALVFEGHSAVALFITLSGFLFALICGPKAEIKASMFYLNRVLRIYPMYTCAILLAVYLSPGNNGILNVMTSLCCMQNLLSPVTHSLITPPLWTVAVEFQFYLLFPFFLRWFTNKGAKPLLLLLAASLALKALVYLQSGSVRDLSYLTLFGRIDQFIVGMLAGWYYPRIEGRLKHPFLVFSSGILVVAMLTAFHAKGGFIGTSNKAIWIVWPLLESIAWMTMIVTYCASVFTLPSRLSKMVCALGAVSFSMYLCHYGLSHVSAAKVGPLIHSAMTSTHHWLHPTVAALFQNPLYGGIIFTAAIVLPIVIAFSALTYHAIEKPFMDMRVKYKV